MLHVDRQGGTWRLLGSVVYIHRQVLCVSQSRRSHVANARFIWPRWIRFQEPFILRTCTRKVRGYRKQGVDGVGYGERVFLSPVGINLFFGIFK